MDDKFIFMIENTEFTSSLMKDNGIYKITPYSEKYSSEDIRNTIQRSFKVKCIITSSIAEKISKLDEQDIENGLQLFDIKSIESENCYFMKIIKEY